MKGKFTFRTTNPNRRMIFMMIVALAPLLVFFFLRDWYTSLSADNDIIVEGLCFLATAAFCIWRTIWFPVKKRRPICGEGCAFGRNHAGIAPLPGLSRSGSTISAGIFAGLTREFAVSFSFILGIPAVLGANIFEVKDALEAGVERQLFTNADWHGGSSSGRISGHQAGTLAGPVGQLQSIHLVYGDFRCRYGDHRRGGKVYPLSFM